MQWLDLDQQIELLVRLISDRDILELMSVIGTLQWLRENESKIRHRLAE